METMGETADRVRTVGRAARIVPAAVLAVIMAVGLGGCGQLRDALGQTKDPPDEFQVVARAPLALPPNYDLRPPRPGAPRPQERSTTDAAAERILGRSARATTANPNAVPAAPVVVNSIGEAKFRQQLGVGQAEPGIRETVDKETAEYVYETRYPIDRLLFWKDDPERGVLLDASREQQRLQENAALGRKPNEGELPTITRNREGLLQRIF
ncbi:DUF3035 domain-containing protein [Thalassobaculum sp.]|uniref:DUF3035 domain-containing protein n=1 Tax=Thalassobaculum sp. TaxID=2022740 RepID=UPI003B59787B